MIYVDGNLVEQREIVAVTKIVTGKLGHTAVNGRFTIALKGGYALPIEIIKSATSSTTQDERTSEIIEELTSIRDYVIKKVYELR